MGALGRQHTYTVERSPNPELLLFQPRTNDWVGLGDAWVIENTLQALMTQSKTEITQSEESSRMDSGLIPA